MAASSGLRPKEVDEMPPAEVWIMIEGHEQNLRNYWEMTRSIAFNVAKFGNSDPKKMPKTPQKFWPFPTDKKATVNNEIWKQHEKMVARREQLMKKQKPK